MPTYTALNKQQAKYLRKRIDECIEFISDRAYNINGELEVMDLDDDQKGWRQDAMQEMDDLRPELEGIIRTMDHLARVRQNVDLTVEQKAARLRAQRRELQEHHDAQRVNERISGQWASN